MPHPFDFLAAHGYIDLTTFRKSGVAVHTPVWFAPINGNLCVMTRSDSGKLKRIRNNPRVEIAPCTMRGRRTGTAVSALAALAPDQAAARAALRRKYWLARLPIWSKSNLYLEIRPA